MVRDPETEQPDDNFKSYKVTHVDARRILIKMEFVEPLKVSQGPEPHLLFIQAQLSEFKSIDGKELPEAMIKRRELPRMQRSEAEAEAVESTSSSAVYSSTTASFLSIVESFALSASLC